MATVNKNFRIKNGLIVEGASGTINGQNILTETGSDQYILDLVGGTNLIDSVASGLSVTSAELSIDRTVVDTWYDASGAAATAQSNAEDYADGLAVNYDPAGTAAGLAANYDPAGAAATAQSNAEDYADGLASNYDPAGAAATAQSNAEDYADGLAVNYDAAGSATTAEGNANNYTDDLIGDLTVDGTSGNTVTARIATAVANLVDSAPEALNTLNELAAALGDNVDGMTGIATAIGNKLPLAGGTMSGNIAMGTGLVTGLGAPTSDNDAARKKYVDDTAATAQSNAEDYADGLAVNYDPAGTAAGLAANYDPAGAAATAQSNAEGYADGLAANYDPAGAAATAQSNAEDYADGLAVNYDPAGTAAGLAANYDPAGAAATAQSNAEGYADDIVGNVISGDTAFTAVNVNSVAGIWAAVTTVASASTVTAWAYNSTVFTSAKLLVSIKANGHSQVSEVLVTLDSTGNVAITEFGIVGTNGSLGEITAINSSGNISIRVTTAYSNSDVIVYATTLL